MFHVKRNGVFEMINVYDFCEACADATMVKLSFFDADSAEFITSLILHDAKTGVKTLSSFYMFSQIECFYPSAELLCVKACVNACSL